MKFRAAICTLLAISWLAQAGAAAGGQQTATNGAAVTAAMPATARQPDMRAGAPEANGSRYRLQHGDTFELMFPFVTAFNQTITVQRDGFVSFRIVGDVQVSGLTVPELAETLRVRYGSILRDPVLTIELRDSEKPYFVAAGEVERPGKYDMRGETTLMQALAIAGGFKDRAKRTHVVVFRRGPDGPKAVQVQEINAKRVLEGRDIVSDVTLQPGDLVFVSKSRIPNMATFISTVLPNLGWLAYMFVNRP